MPVNMTNYIDSPGAPRRAVYPDFTIAYGGAAGLMIGVPLILPHGVNLLPGYNPGLNDWLIPDRNIFSWRISTTPVPPLAYSFGTLVITNQAGIGVNEFKIIAIDDYDNYMEGLYIPGLYCRFTFYPSNNDSNLRWFIKAQGV